MFTFTFVDVESISFITTTETRSSNIHRQITTDAFHLLRQLGSLFQTKGYRFGKEGDSVSESRRGECCSVPDGSWDFRCEVVVGFGFECRWRLCFVRLFWMMMISHWLVHHCWHTFIQVHFIFDQYSHWYVPRFITMIASFSASGSARTRITNIKWSQNVLNILLDAIHTEFQIKLISFGFRLFVGIIVRIVIVTSVLYIVGTITSARSSISSG